MQTEILNQIGAELDFLGTQKDICHTLCDLLMLGYYSQNSSKKDFALKASCLKSKLEPVISGLDSFSVENELNNKIVDAIKSSWVAISSIEISEPEKRDNSIQILSLVEKEILKHNVSLILPLKSEEMDLDRLQYPDLDEEKEEADQLSQEQQKPEAASGGIFSTIKSWIW